MVTPLAHDALSAALIERAGFHDLAIGGSALLAARYALPDIGLIGLGDMAAGIGDIASATSLPFFADGDDGYGGSKNVVRMVEVYEALGVGGILIEDQERGSKQQPAEPAQQVSSEAAICDKLRVAMVARDQPDTFIVGRTDAYGPLGLDAAIRRANLFLDLGVDGVFVAGLRTESDYERVGRTLEGAVLSAAIFGGKGLPWLTASRLGEMGFRHVSFPAYLISRVAGTMHSSLSALRAYTRDQYEFPSPEHSDVTRRVLDDAVNLAKWSQFAS